MRAFAGDRGGNIAMIFGLSLIPLSIAAGVGLDMSRAMITRNRLGTALDAAGLAVGAQPSLSIDDMQKLAREYFQANYTADAKAYGTPTPVAVTRPQNSQTITLSTDVAMPTTLMRLVGIKTMSLHVSSQITWGQTKLWVALALDNTGSMCEPGSQPCSTPLTTSKIYALKQATHNLLQMLENAAANDGDVKVSIVPFSKDVNVGTDDIDGSWIDWSDWEAPPPNSMPDKTVGPGSSCPYGTRTSPYGYSCDHTQNGNIATSGTYAGMICPGADNGRYNSGDGSTVQDNTEHDYNGCYNSVASGTSSTEVCTGKHCSCGHTDNCSCTGTGKKTVCTQTVTKYSHTWKANDHSTWSGCITDRAQDLDTENTAPDNSFPAENSGYCPPGTVTPLGYDWDKLSDQVDAMTANGNTNQTIGLAWAWQTLTNSDPFSPGEVPEDTRKVLILLTDGLNTQNRWSEDQSDINDRTEAVCKNIKDDDITVYAIQVNTSGDPKSDVLVNCASDSSKYFELTAADQIVTAFQQIGTQITNLRVSL
ncbi:MAG TPA: pilus assembly protein [Rhizomicrobium sp.]|nr:pilus assembly protein [Rhizomicrobium sp.]